MKIRIFVYGFLILAICLLATIYLVYANQERILQAAKYKLTEIALEKWDVDLEIEDSRLSLYRNIVFFKNIGLNTKDGKISLRIAKMEMYYSLRKLIKGVVHFRKISLEKPELEITYDGMENGIRTGKFPHPREIIAGMAVARNVEMEKGTLLVSDLDKKNQLLIEGLGMQLAVSEEKVDSRLWVDKLNIDFGIYHGLFRKIFMQGSLDQSGMAVSRIDLEAESGPLEASGRINPDGTLWADFSINGDLEKLQYTLERKIPMLSGWVTGEGRFEFQKSDWSVKSRVETRGLTINGEPIPDARADVSLGRHSCLFSNIEGRVPSGGRLIGNGELNWSQDLFSYDFKVGAKDVFPAEVGYVIKHFPTVWYEPAGPLSGNVEFSSEIEKGKDSGWAVLIDLKGHAEKYFASREVHVSGTVESGGPGISKLKNFVLTAGSLKANWAGTIDEEAGTSIALIAETEDLSESLRPYNLEWIGGQASFAGDIIGKGPSVTVAGGVTAEPVYVNNVLFDKVWGRVNYREGIYEAEELNIHKGGGEARLSGSVIPSENNYIVGKISLTDMVIGDGRKMIGLDLPVEGSFSGNISVTGVPEYLTGSARLSSPGLSIRSWFFRETAADFRFTPEAVFFKNLEGVYRNARIAFGGSWEKSGYLKGEIKGEIPRAEEFFQDSVFGGKVEIKGDFHGRWPDPDFRGGVTWSNVRFMDVSQPDITLDVEKKNHTIKGHGLLMERFSLSMEADARKPYPLNGKIDFTDLSLKTILPYLKSFGQAKLAEYISTYESRADGDIEFMVPLSDPGSFSGKANIEKMEVILGDEISTLKGPAELLFSRGSVLVDKVKFEGGLHHLILEGGLESGRLSLGLEGVLDLSFLAQRDPSLRKLNLKPEISLQVTGPPSSPEMSGSARISGGELGVTWLEKDFVDLTAQAEFDRQIVRFHDFSAGYGQSILRGSGGYNLKENMLDILLRGSMQINTTELKIPGIKEYSADAQFEAEISGSPGNPGIAAEISIKDGLIRFEDIKSPLGDLTLNPLRDVFLEVSVSNEHIRIKDVEANLNGGRIKGLGYLVWVRGGMPEEIDLALTAEKIPLNLPGTLKIITSVDLNLRGSPEEYLLGGQLVLERGKYFRDITPRPVISFSQVPKEKLIKQVAKNPFLSNLRLNLQLFAEEGFWIDNNIARINSGIDVKFTGTPQEIILSGDVRVHKGTIYYLGKKFDLEEAYIIFQESYPPDPHIYVEAVTIVPKAAIHLQIQGTLSSLTPPVLYSDPPYSQEDIISLLTMGAPRSSLENRGREISAMGALTVFSGSFLSTIENEARDFTGLEVFQIEPTLSDTGGAARLIVGEQLSERIFLSYSRNLSTTGDEQFSMEYQLLDFLSLVGKQDRQGTYSFELVSSFEGLGWLGK